MTRGVSIGGTDEAGRGVPAGTMGGPMGMGGGNRAAAATADTGSSPSAVCKPNILRAPEIRPVGLEALKQGP